MSPGRRRNLEMRFLRSHSNGSEPRTTAGDPRAAAIGFLRQRERCRVNLCEERSARSAHRKDWPADGNDIKNEQMAQMYQADEPRTFKGDRCLSAKPRSGSSRTAWNCSPPAERSGGPTALVIMLS